MHALKVLRERKGLLQKEVAAEIGVDRTTYVKYERGDSEPSFAILQKLADFFEVSVDYLLGREEQKKEPESDNGSELDAQIINLLQELPEERKEEVRRYVEFLRASSKDS